MNSLGQVLEQIRDQWKSTTQEQTNLAVEGLFDEPECKLCGDRRFLSDNGKAIPCPVCVLASHENVDWFAGLDAPTKLREKALALAKKMASSPSGWLVLQGPPGTGKSTLGKAILSTWAGKEMVPITTSWLLNEWRSRIWKDTADHMVRQYCEAPRMVLDDLGAERITEWAQERLTMLLDWRYAHRLPTVIMVNQDLPRLAEHAGDRIADRVFDERSGLVRVVSLTGRSFRTGRDWINGNGRRG